jgi:hypothetical protein
MNPALSLLKEAGTSNLISDRNTMEYVLEKLSKGFPKVMRTGNQTIKLGTEACATIVSTELSVFITASQFSITCLSDLWDNKDVYQYGTRGKGEWNIKEPTVSLFGASAPNWLIKSIPADAVGGGFTRRVNFVLANKKDKKVAWPTNHKDPIGPLVEDLRHIASLHGEFTFTPAAETLFKDYYNACEPDDFDDEAVSAYKTSKWVNATKIAQILSVARDDNLVINEQDFLTAMEKTEEVQKEVAIVFRSVGESSLASASDKLINFLEVRGFASRAEILSHNWRHFTSGELDVLLATFREANMILERNVGTKTLYSWIGDKKP